MEIWTRVEDFEFPKGIADFTILNFSNNHHESISIKMTDATEEKLQEVINWDKKPNETIRWLEIVETNTDNSDIFITCCT